MVADCADEFGSSTSGSELGGESLPLGLVLGFTQQAVEAQGVHRAQQHLSLDDAQRRNSEESVGRLGRRETRFDEHAFSSAPRAPTLTQR
jgi:hypothetical protein